MSALKGATTYSDIPVDILKYRCVETFRGSSCIIPTQFGF
jgi:hypothetical protein